MTVCVNKGIVAIGVGLNLACVANVLQSSVTPLSNLLLS